MLKIYMVLQLAEIIFNDSQSKYNKDLTDFLARNIETIILRGQIKFRFKIAKPADLSVLRGKGIKKLPAMILQNKHYTDVPSIVEELRRRVKQSKGDAPAKTDEEFIDEYLKNTLGDVKKDQDGKHVLPVERDEDEGPDLMALASRAMEQRSGNAPEQNARRNTTAVRPPDRTALQDDDYEDAAPPPRNNNVDAADDAGDAVAAMQRIARREGNEDDHLTRMMLDKLGSD